jgi:flagellar protein FliS
MTTSIRDPQRRYQAVQVRTSSRSELCAMLFKGLMRFLDEARSGLEAGDRPRAGDRIGRAHAILAHLSASLDHGPMPELAANLDALYQFSMGRITEANLHQDAARIADAERALRPVALAFQEIAGSAEARVESP